MKHSPESSEENATSEATSNAMSEVAFDAVLRSALIARPEPYAASNLVKRALDQAHTSARLSGVTEKRRVTPTECVTWLVAAAALVAVMAAGVWRVIGLRAAAMVSDSSTTSTVTSTVSSTDGIEAMLLAGVVALAGAVVYLAVQGSGPSDEDRYDLVAP